METEHAKIYQHHTSRQSLLPWANSDERVAWYGYGKIILSGLTVVGGEDIFYKLRVRHVCRIVVLGYDTYLPVTIGTAASGRFSIDRILHSFAIGHTGVGKSTFQTNSFIRLIRQG